MVGIDLHKVHVDFPVFNVNGRSFKKDVINVATGGRLEAQNKSIVYVKALNDLSLNLSEGDRLAVVGHNGAGKSTFLRLLNQVYYPSHGTCAVDGRVSSLINISLGMDAELSGRQNIFMRGAFLGMRSNEIKKSLNEIIDFSELGNFIDLPVRTYSTGMLMRLAFSISTCINPDILLMDEWLSVGDESFKDKAMLRLENLVSRTKILVLATHSKDLIVNACNKALWLEHGTVRGFGPVQDVVDIYFSSKK